MWNNEQNSVLRAEQQQEQPVPWRQFDQLSEELQEQVIRTLPKTFLEGIPLSYSRVEFDISDHRPVTAYYVITAKEIEGRGESVDYGMNSRLPHAHQCPQHNQQQQTQQMNISTMPVQDETEEADNGKYSEEENSSVSDDEDRDIQGEYNYSQLGIAGKVSDVQGVTRQQQGQAPPQQPAEIQDTCYKNEVEEKDVSTLIDQQRRLSALIDQPYLINHALSLAHARSSMEIISSAHQLLGEPSSDNNEFTLSDFARNRVMREMQLRAVHSDIRLPKLQTSSSTNPCKASLDRIFSSSTILTISQKQSREDDGTAAATAVKKNDDDNLLLSITANMLPKNEGGAGGGGGAGGAGKDSKIEDVNLVWMKDLMGGDDEERSSAEVFNNSTVPPPSLARMAESLPFFPDNKQTYSHAI